MKKLLLGIFAFTFTATFAQDPVYVSVTGTCEASGGITLKTIRAYAETGVDYISTSKITLGVPAIDIGLDLD